MNLGYEQLKVRPEESVTPLREASQISWVVVDMVPWLAKGPSVDVLQGTIPMAESTAL